MDAFFSQLQQKKVLIFTVIVVLLISFIVGALVGAKNNNNGTVPVFANNSALPPEGVDLAPLWKSWNVLNEKFVSASSTKVVSNEDKLWGLIKGLTDAYGDPYTVFLPPADAEIFEADISGNFQGVGMEIGTKDGTLTVVAPLKGTPAYNAGIKSGDKIITIDGTDAQSMPVDQAVRLIRGEKGTTVTFTLLREGEKELLTIPVVRDIIQIPTISVSGEDGAGLREDGVFVIQLFNFSAISQNLFREALRDFIQSGSNKLVLDLRGNPGGFLEASVDMASWFLPVGKVVVEENFGDEEKPRMHRSRGYNIFNDTLKMAILVNRGSASASEILAGALQEHGVATLVGERTFGKGSVQELVQITETTSLKVTIARWLTPKGNSISNGGLTPDIEVAVTAKDREAGVDPQLEQAAEFLLSL